MTGQAEKDAHALQPPSTETQTERVRPGGGAAEGSGPTGLPGQGGRWLQSRACPESPAQARPGGLLEGAGLVQERRRVLEAGRPSGLQEDEHSLQLDHPDQKPSTGHTRRQRVRGTCGRGSEGRRSLPGHSA